MEKSLNELNGVASVNVDLENKSVKVEYDASKVKVDAMKAAIEDAGYDVVGNV
ncbi:hypothetical protein skT53_33450 [Effusibacillus dendaii]|uniref:HMA domain-containing protein n=1 Tax=Effusibacillus dendaii TaxID=2743772 RepID=A0A7I8DI79_9BACL|nr:hypothetical protein skT53_33450 [Effusibacillus dendaii]